MTHHVHTALILADQYTDKGKGILDASNGIGGPIKAIFAAIGVLIVIFTLFKLVKPLTNGKYPEAARNLAGGIIVAALCFNLNLPISMVTGVGGLLSTAWTSFSGLFSA